MTVRTIPACLDAALAYLARGWSPLPLCPHDHAGAPASHLAACRRPGKVPLVNWEPLQTRAATRGQLETWWKHYPAANVGVALGPVSGLLGLDVDGQGGEDLLAHLSQGDLPPTLEFTTGAGRRLLYLWPDSVDVPNQEYSFGQGEVRILGKGRQTVMPPSLHPSGAEYAWSEGGEPHAEHAPAWLLSLIVSADTPVLPVKPAAAQPQAANRILARARQYLRECEPAVSGAGGHAHTFKLAVKLVKGFGLDAEAACQLMLTSEWNARCCDTDGRPCPWTEQELRHKCLDAARQGNQEGFLRDQPRNGAAHGPAVNGHAANGRAHAAPAAAAKPAPPPPEIVTAAELNLRTFDPVRWAVDGVLPEGAALFAGPPKAGKSFLTLGFTLAIAFGGTALGRIPVDQGEVLYLALEDGHRRLQARMRRVLQAWQCPAPEGLHLAVEWPRATEGGLDLLGEWVDKHPHARLVVIDTLAKLRDRRASNDNLYDSDYDAINALQQIGIRRNLAILILHHTRKATTDDPLESVSGTMGLTGAADTILVLKRPREGPLGTLFVTGRDIEEERKIPLLWNKDLCTWSIRDAEETLPRDQVAVVRAITAAGHPLAIPDCVLALGLPAGDEKAYFRVAQLLKRMVGDGLLHKSGRGRYDLPGRAVPPEGGGP